MNIDMITFASKSMSNITIGATIEEVYTDELQITEHPVEKGAQISDHAFMHMPEVVIKCGWSNADYMAILGTSEAVFDSGTVTVADYVNSVYSQLLSLQGFALPFDVVTSRRKYSNMLLKSLSVMNDAKTTAALMVTAVCKQVRIVKTKATTLPPRENQAKPATTAETQNAGVKAATPATPAPGGAVAPSQW